MIEIDVFIRSDDDFEFYYARAYTTDTKNLFVDCYKEPVVREEDLDLCEMHTFLIDSGRKEDAVKKILDFYHHEDFEKEEFNFFPPLFDSFSYMADVFMGSYEDYKIFDHHSTNSAEKVFLHSIEVYEFSYRGKSYIVDHIWHESGFEEFEIRDESGSPVSEFEADDVIDAFRGN